MALNEHRVAKDSALTMVFIAPLAARENSCSEGCPLQASTVHCNTEAKVSSSNAEIARTSGNDGGIAGAAGIWVQIPLIILFEEKTSQSGQEGEKSNIFPQDMSMDMSIKSC